MRGRRLLGGLAALTMVGGAVAATRLDQPARPVALSAAEPPAGPTAAPAGAASAAWHCPGGPLAQADQAEVTVVLANSTGAAIDARITPLPEASAAPTPRDARVTVPARGSTSVRLAEVTGTRSPAGATVIAAGGLVAQQLIKTPEGASVGPCASAASDRWYTSVGSTAAGTSLYLALLNPFPDQAIVDLAFSTDQGRAVPGDLQGVVVAPRSLLVVDVGDKVRRREAVAAEVVARRGRLVVGRNFRKGTGSSTALGAPSPAPTWYLPAGVRSDGATNRLVVANPSDQDAEVSVELRLQEGVAEPLTLAVPAQDRAELNLDDPRVPKGVPYAVTVRSGDDVPVVVERSSEGRTGRSDVLGAQLPDRGWVAAAAGPRGPDVLAVYNAGDAEADVTVTPLDGRGAVLPGPALRVAPGVRATLRLDDKPAAKGAAVLVESGQPLVVERDSGEGGPTLGGSVAAALGR